MKTIAVMQPYFFPYIGYFQLVRAVDKFIFYDDVNFIKNGWINRNRILLNNQASYITVQLKDASSFKRINCVEFTDNRGKLKKTIEQTYKKAPHFKSAWPIIEGCLNLEKTHICDLAIYSVVQVAQYLGIETAFEMSSQHYPGTKELEKAERLKEICRLNSADQYINPSGGAELYDKSDFAARGIDLKFLKTKTITYKQFKDGFIPQLSIIDVIMFNSPEEISLMLDQCELA